MEELNKRTEASVHKVWLGLGTNLGNKRANLAKALEMLLKEDCNILAESAVYSSAPWGFESKNKFYNICVLVESQRSPKDLLELIKDIETTMGRVSDYESYEDRIIDIDILFYENLVLHTEKLRIPHPRIEERMFVLKPLTEIAGDKLHPVFNETMAQLLKKCNDDSSIQRLS